MRREVIVDRDPGLFQVLTGGLETGPRDAKILDIFEGTQQIQLLIIARQLLGLTSAQLK